ncbi:heat-inducible transcriptional repressor HrcA [Aphanothece hegewaldii CCALA 016]|uniref:Heat-inducible transcription repressor HrcA n=1 Tax=Aphanothece hegewaldii CCALA 016 TaxID=2107694 RepID=A0A2T1LSP5_9CHRO|nr:heat-inducible transcriptional repressor HrcA [Aphanothece hegewaldii]PSF33071.1 heat-inducible transcriptional repressor HrcA [Aphanothece hegewaldii CCALA 016]
MPKSNLNERYQKILKATVKHYIATAEPVGSKTLVEGYNFRVSSATIRNVLGQLEKEGFLYQPHTSSGRVPSDSGYRIYVDELMSPDETISKQVEQNLLHQLKRESWHFDTLLQRATQILANISGYIAIITLPQTASNKLKHLQLVQVSSKQMMLIIVTDGYQTQSVLMDIPATILDDETEVLAELNILSNFLNHQLKGYSVSELVNLDWSRIDQEFLQYKNFIKNLVQEISQRLQVEQTPSIIMHGVSEVLRHPEFSHLQQVQMLLHLLEQQQDQLIPLICEYSESETLSKKVNVRIGSENPLKSMRICTLVSAVYRQGEYPVGSVGIIGPTRMLYENTISLVETTADYLTEALSDFITA